MTGSFELLKNKIKPTNKAAEIYSELGRDKMKSKVQIALRQGFWDEDWQS